MRIIKLDATDSTNTYLKELVCNERVEDYTIVTAEHQTNGRGQMGTIWESDRGKNLMFSLFKDLSIHVVEFPFYISMAISLAIIKALQCFQIPNLTIKWPNDILSADKKIAGILIENVIKNKLNSTIIGIGINVNQIEFPDLPQASSLKKITGIHYNLDEILHHILKQTKWYSELLQKGEYEIVKKEYESHLFRKDMPSTFKSPNGEIFLGFVQGVTKYGKLMVRLEDDIVKKFDLKEVQLKY